MRKVQAIVGCADVNDLKDLVSNHRLLLVAKGISLCCQLISPDHKASAGRNAA